MQALILCGGLGTRLRSVVADSPKSMAPIRGIPFLHVLLERLKDKGFSDFVLATGYQSDTIEQYFRNGGKWGVSIVYSREAEPLGTGGAVKLAEPHLRDKFFILNGDTFLEFDPERMEKLMEAKKAAMVVALKAMEGATRYGKVVLDADGRVEGFHEKAEDSGPGLINAGVYLARAEMLVKIERGKMVSLEREVIPALLGLGIYGCEMKGLFIDIGVPADYQRAQVILPGDAHARQTI